MLTLLTLTLTLTLNLLGEEVEDVAERLQSISIAVEGKKKIRDGIEYNIKDERRKKLRVRVSA